MVVFVWYFVFLTGFDSPSFHKQNTWLDVSPIRQAAKRGSLEDSGWVMDNWGGFDSVDDMWGFFNRKTNSKGYGTNSIPFFFVIVLGWLWQLWHFFCLSIPGRNGVSRFWNGTRQNLRKQSCLQRGLGEVFWRKLSVKRSNEKDLFMKRNEKVDGSRLVLLITYPLWSWVWLMRRLFLKRHFRSDDFGSTSIRKRGPNTHIFMTRHVLKENMFDFRSPQIIRVDAATCFRPKGTKHNFQIKQKKRFMAPSFCASFRWIGHTFTVFPKNIHHHPTSPSSIGSSLNGCVSFSSFYLKKYPSLGIGFKVFIFTRT